MSTVARLVRFYSPATDYLRTCGNNSVVRMANNTQKESAQDNGGAEYSLADTFGLYRAGRFVREDTVSSEGGDFLFGSGAGNTVP